MALCLTIITESSKMFSCREDVFASAGMPLILFFFFLSFFFFFFCSLFFLYILPTSLQSIVPEWSSEGNYFSKKNKIEHYETTKNEAEKKGLKCNVFEIYYFKIYFCTF